MHLLPFVKCLSYDGYCVVCVLGDYPSQIGSSRHVSLRKELVLDYCMLECSLSDGVRSGVKQFGL